MTEVRVRTRLTDSIQDPETSAPMLATAPTSVARPIIDPPGQAIFELSELSLWYAHKHAIADIGMKIPVNKVTALIGPSGCGKSTLLRCLNRMNDLIDGVRVTGSIRIGGVDVTDPSLDVTELRKRVGMVFQKPNPFPKTIYDNVAF